MPVPILVVSGVLELTVGVLSGWLMLLASDRPAWLRALGLRDAGYLRKGHLDLLFMGVIQVAVGVAVSPLPLWIAIPIVIGAVVQPLSFFALSARPSLRESAVFQAAELSVFVVFTAGWLALATLVVLRVW